jgi:UDP-N-acetylmuramate--alanine ligase
MDDFGPSFTGADVVVLTDIYAAGEDPIAGVSAEALAKKIRGAYRGDLQLVRRLDDVPRELARIARPGDLIVLLGAGSIGSIWRKVLSELERGSQN